MAELSNQEGFDYILSLIKNIKTEVTPAIANLQELNSHFQVIADNHQLEINSMKAEIEVNKTNYECFAHNFKCTIESIKAENEELRGKYVVSTNFLAESKEETQKMFEGLNSEIEQLKQVIKNVANKKEEEKPRQERFQRYIRFELREGKQGEPFNLYDNDRTNKWVCDIGSKTDAYYILDALNKLSEQEGK